ncbi:hypothetical protein BDV28DRAFT_162370 [Aspergillus coremiiformis]|uniref:Aminoglycoside phosphotransferase domain-containing protein n=1 Tax=Aspergillus coremiiformis TaxID=138285 RepID=A0A5N6Z302_9EURO|nr:hypothetical protein BDV28DRAFT_162370 [Aspergillus coremiiformis]
MGDASPPLSLASTEAVQWNKNLMQEFHAALERDPAADLMSIFPYSYLLEHRNAQYHQQSYAAKINLRTLNELRDTLRHEPEINLLSAFPKNYTRRITMATGSRVVPRAEQDISENRGPPDFRKRLDLAEDATIVSPLSKEVAALLAPYSGELPDNRSRDSEKLLIRSLKQLLWDSPKLWENPVRGIVVKCGEDIVAKVIMGNNDYTEYTSMQYLAEQMPTIPAPRPHGLIAFGPLRVIFMSCIPGMTLTEAWPRLTHEEKLSVQSQLDKIFRRLRNHRLHDHDGRLLGGVGGEGVKELRVDECSSFKDVRTATEFSDLQLSACHHGSTTYIRFLHSFLEHDNSTLGQELVFTHGDVRTDNIMVKQDTDINGSYIVTGIIDWEYSGFYPAYYECTVLTRTLSVVNEDDWYLYLPDSISPSHFPIRWLVDRLWGIHLRTT